MNKMIKRLLAVVLVASMLLGSNGISYAAEKANGDGIAGTEEAMQTGEAGEQMESSDDTEESEPEKSEEDEPEPVYDSLDEADPEDRAQEEADEEETEEAAESEGADAEAAQGAATDEAGAEGAEADAAGAGATEGAAAPENTDAAGEDAAVPENTDAAGAEAALPENADAADLTAEQAAAAQAQEEVFTAGELVYHGADYDVTLVYDENAKIPAAAELRVREIAEGTSEYNAYLKGAEAAAGKGVAEARFFDITILSAGTDGQQQEIQPQSPVRVNITYHKALEVAEEGEVRAMHFEDGSSHAEVVNADTDGGSEVSEIAFDAESFSVYGIVYTVDFTYDGYTYCIEGGSSIYLSELAQILGLYETDLDKAFSVGNVSDVSFTDYELVKIEKQAGGDWLLTSLAPFTSEETLTIEMNDGVTFIVDVTDAMGDEWTESSELVNFLTNAVISGAASQGGAYVVEPNKSYGITLTFKEGRQWQFANHSTLTYDMPAGMYIPENQTRQLTIAVTSGGVTYEVDAVLSVSTDGKLTFKFDEEDPEYPRLANANNVSLRAKFDASFDGSETSIRFSDSVEKDVIIDDDDHSDVFVTKSGTFDEAEGTYHYTIKVTAAGNPEEVNVKDVLSGTALVFNNDVQVTGYSGSFTENPVTGKGFDYTFSEMKDGEEITITYSASLDPGEMADADEINADMTRNTVTVKKDGGEPHNAEYSHTVNLKIPDKSNGSEAGTTADGNKIYNWTIEYNKLALAGCAGDIVRDTIAIGSRSYMKYYGNITVKVYDHEGDLVDTRSFTPGNSAEWQYTVPGGDTTPYRYVFEYQTVADQAEVDGLAAEMTLYNNSEGPGGTDLGGVVVSPREKVTITKEAVTSDTNEVTWISHIHVPEGGLAQAIVTDRVPVLWQNGRNYFDMFKDGSLEISGLLPGESHSDPVVEGDLGTVTITFFKDSGKTQTGLQPAVGGHDITIKLTTKVNQEWLEIGYEEGGRKLDHVNTIGINGIEATATVIFTKPDIRKTGVEQADHLYMYTLTLSGVSEEPISIEDLFDTGVLELYADYTAWNNLKIYGGDQHNQSYGGYPVNYSQTENGVLLTANSIPKQPDGKYYSHYRIVYYAKLKDGIDPEELAVENGGKYELINTAKWGDHESDFKFTYEYDALSKELITAATAENHYATYRITFNPRKAALNDGRSFPMTDTLNKNLSIDHSSVTITTDPAGVYVPYSISGEKDEDGNPTGGTVATYEIPDETAVTIEYRAMVVGTGTVTYKNTVEVRDEKETVEEEVDMSTSGGGEASQFSVKAVKVDGYDANKKLQGVKFKLYSSSGISLYPADHPDYGHNSAIIETDENGILDISYEKYGFSLIEDEKYYLEEQEAAPGYQILSFPYQFTLTQEMAHVDWDQYVYYNGETFQIKNWPLEGLVVEKIVDVEVPEPAGESYKTKEYSFKLEILDQDGSVDTSVNAKYGDYDFVEGSAVFTLKDKQQVSFWNLPKDTKFRVTETDSQGLAVWAGEGETSEKREDGSYSGITKGDGEYTLVTFTNKKEEVGSLKIKKSVTVNGETTTGTSADGTYTFTVTGPNDYSSEQTITITNGASKEVQVDNLVPGTYTVSEDISKNPAGMALVGGNDLNIEVTANNTAGIPTAEFTNTRKTGDLEVTKTVDSKTASDMQKDFNFTVTLTPALSGEFGDMTFNESGVATFTLRHGQTKSASGLPVGYSYKVEEETAAGFVTTKTGETGTISATKATAAFTNTKAEGGLIVSKKVVSVVTADSNKDFVFEVELTDKSVNGTYGEMNFENGIAKFTLKNGETRKATGLADAIGFTVSEEAASDFITTSTGETGVIVEKETKTAEFVNMRKTGSLEISKTVVSPMSAEKDADYTFTVTLTNGDQKISGQYSEYYFDENGQATVTVAGGSSKTIEGLPVGTTYTVEEAEYDNFITESTGEAGDINDAKTSVAAFTNTRKTGGLEVTKTVVNKNSADTTSEFSFTVTLGDKTINGKFGDMTFNEGVAEFTLKDGEKSAAEGLPAKVSYVVEEANAEGFKITKEGEAGEISESIVTASFTNTYRATGDINLEARKALEGRTMTDGQFGFELIDADGKVLQTKYNDAAGIVCFDKITYSQDDLQKNEEGFLEETLIEYTVKEVIPDDAVNTDGTAYKEASEAQKMAGGFKKDGYTYDGSVHMIKVELKDNGDGTIDAKVAGTQGEPGDTGIIFTNAYGADGTLKLDAEKIFRNGMLKGGEFTFELIDADGKILQSKQNDAAGNVSFDMITYRIADAAKAPFTYTVREVPGNRTDVKYDATVYTVTVELKDKGDGTLEVMKKIDNGGALKFVNERLNIETSVTIGGVKVLKGRALKKDEFQFVLADADGRWVGAATNDAEGNFTFKPISYKLFDLNGEKEKVYTYSVREVKGSENGITYDMKVYTVKVTVTDNGDGTMTAEADRAKSEIRFVNTASEKSSKKTGSRTGSSKGSKTGDEAPLGVLFGGLGLGAAGLAVLLWYRRKKNKSDE